MRIDLEELGFEGFVPFAALPEVAVPSGPGVYAVVRPGFRPPRFLEISPAGRHRDRDPTVDVETLRAAWVPAVETLYLGKATPGRDGRRGLRRRLDEYRRHGAGEPVGHWGGRYVWQLEDAAELLVAWAETSDADAGVVESRLIAAFEAQTRRLPFANLRH